MKLSDLTILLVRTNRRTRCFHPVLEKGRKFGIRWKLETVGELLPNEGACQAVGQFHQLLLLSLVLDVRNLWNGLDQ